MLPKNRKPTSPGEILEYEFLEPLGITKEKLAQEIHVSQEEINKIIEEKAPVTPVIALRFSKFFDTSVEFWTGLQTELDIWETLRAHKLEYESIKPVSVL